MASSLAGFPACWDGHWPIQASLTQVECCLWLSRGQVLFCGPHVSLLIKLNWSFPFVYLNQKAWSFVVNFFGISLMTIEVEFLCLCLMTFGVSLIF